jgi:hypothetical protein
MSKTADSNFLAKKIGFSQQVFWGYCDSRTEIFHHLFGPQLMSEFLNLTDYSRFVRINNNVPQFVKLIRSGPEHECRSGPEHECQCSVEKATCDADFYGRYLEWTRFEPSTFVPTLL